MLIKNVLLLRAVSVVLYWTGFIRFKKVPKVILRQLSRHISNPQRSAGASESNKNIITIKNKTKQNILFKEKNMNGIQLCTYPGCTTDWSWPPAARQKDLFKKHTHGGYIPLHTHITAAMLLIEDADALLSKWRMYDLTRDNIRTGCQNSGHSWIFLQQQDTLPLFETMLLIKEQINTRERFHQRNFDPK